MSLDQRVLVIDTEPSEEVVKESLTFNPTVTVNIIAAKGEGGTSLAFIAANSWKKNLFAAEKFKRDCRIQINIVRPEDAP